MTWRKIFRRCLIAFLIVIFLLSAAMVGAAVQIFDGKGQYIMSDFEKHDIAKQRSQQRAERDAQKKAGVALKTFSRTINSELADEEVSAVTNNIIKVSDVKIVPLSFEAEGESGLMYRATLKATIDVEGIYTWIKRDDNEKIVIIQQNKDLQDAMTKNDEQAEVLKAKYKLATSESEKIQIRKQMDPLDRYFSAYYKNAEGDKLFYAGDYNEAIKLYGEAMQLCEYTLAYNGRACAYAELKQYERAIQDFDKALELNPNFYQAHFYRGNVHYYQRQYERAVQDYDNAIRLNPNDEAAYNNRGLAYQALQQYERAVQDLSKSLKLKPNYDLAYKNRGIVYSNLKKYEQAIQDFDKAIQLNPNAYETYNCRCIAYVFLGNFNQAIADATKALELNPNDGVAYHLRGVCYQQLGDKSKAQADFAKAKEFGYNG